MTIYLPHGQYAVLRALLFDGANNREVAERLFIAEDTVKTQLKNIYFRLQQTGRLRLAVAIYSGQITIRHGGPDAACRCQDRNLLEDIHALQSATAAS